MIRKNSSYVLGLDLGSNSVGWAAISFSEDTPVGVLASGVRIFEAGMEGNIEAGRGESRAAIRRAARLARRQTERRTRRRQKVYRLLQRMGLLPDGESSDVIPALDQDLLDRHRDDFCPDGLRRLDNILPYWLRTRGLDYRLEPDELGRALYHLSHRRGFQSSRRSAQKNDEELGQVKQEISQLEEEMAAANARTLGEYFARLDPHKHRIRCRWTSREMYWKEFNELWAAQQPHHPDILTEENRDRFTKALFHQRPLKSAKGLVGRCDLEPTKRRAPWACLEAQESRMLQMVNNCKVITSDGELCAFTPEERSTLLSALGQEGDLKFSKVKKLLGFKRTFHFTLEEGGETRFVGNRIAPKMREVLGDRWDEMTDVEREQVLEDLRSFQKVDALYRRAKRAYGLGEDSARQFAETELEDGYANLSRAAMRKLLPHLREGKTFMEARMAVYGRPNSLSTEVHDMLPPLTEYADLRNPVVTRALTEMRKVVNAVIRKYDKPEIIRVELAREMKQAKSHRQRTAALMRKREKERQDAAEAIAKEISSRSPRPGDILKILLADECDWTCPYTGKQISMRALLGESPQFDIEHIIPFGRCLDDSFLNKTLCYHEENRNVKGNRAPAEVYSEERLSEILQRVRAFKGDTFAVQEKLRRFQINTEQISEWSAGFIDRQMNDTRYISKFAMQYLACLYGGLWDAAGKRRVQAVSGGTTGYLRELWDLNGLLGNSNGPKTRDDHRHHAVDAVVVALTSPGSVQALTKAALQAWKRPEHRSRFISNDPPWPDFVSDVAETVQSIFISHRPRRKVRGPLHGESNYATTKDGQVHIRRQLKSLKAKEVECIADPCVRRAVLEKLHELKETNPEKAFADRNNHPVLVARNGQHIPIHKVKIQVSAKPTAFGGTRGAPRLVANKSNHHIEIVAVLDAEGSETKWEGHIVSTYEAMKRLVAADKPGARALSSRKGNANLPPVVRKDHGPSRTFLFSIAPGDTLEIRNPSAWKDTWADKPNFIVITTVSVSNSGSIEVAGHSLEDARLQKEIKKDKALYRIRSMKTMRELQPKKVNVSPLGDVTPAND